MLKKLPLAIVMCGVMVTLVFASCKHGTKESFLENFSNFMSDVNTSSQNYSTDDWKSADKKFADFKNKDFPRWKDELSTAEKVQVNLEIANYEALKLKKGINEVKGQFKDAVNMGKSIIKDVKGDTTKTK